MNLLNRLRSWWNPPPTVEQLRYQDFHDRVTAMEERVDAAYRRGEPSWPQGPNWAEMTEAYRQQLNALPQKLTGTCTATTVRTWFTPSEVMAYAERKGVRLT